MPGHAHACHAGNDPARRLIPGSVRTLFFHIQAKTLNISRRLSVKRWMFIPWLWRTVISNILKESPPRRFSENIYNAGKNQDTVSLRRRPENGIGACDPQLCPCNNAEGRIQLQLFHPQSRAVTRGLYWYAAGFALTVLPDGDYGVEAATWAAQLDGSEIIVLDGYAFNTAYQQHLKAKGNKLVCIDDIHAYHFLADAVINHAGGVAMQDYSLAPLTRAYLGTAYALLRPAFLENDNNADREDAIFISWAGQIRITIRSACWKCSGRKASGRNVW